MNLTEDWYLAHTLRAEDGCLLWTRATTKKGYGLVAYRENGRKHQTTAHRFVWIKTHGPIDPSLVVCHTCDTPPCVDIDHLFVGTQSENLADMLIKGRGIVGINSHLAKLTADQVSEIRRRYVPPIRVGMPNNSKDLAAEFGISRDHVTQLVRGDRRRWDGA